MFEFITDNIPNWVKHPIDTWNNWHPIDDAENSIKDYTKKKIQQGSEFALESAGVPTDMARSMVGDVPATTPTAGNNPTATAQQASDTKTTVGADGSVEIVNPDGSTRPKEKPGLIQNLLGMLGFGGGSEKSDDSKKDSWFGDLMSGIGSAVSGMFSNGIMGFIEGLIKLAVMVIGALIVKPAMSLLGGMFGGGTQADAGSTPAQGTGGSSVPQKKGAVAAFVDNVEEKADALYNRGKVFWETHTTADSKLMAMSAVDFFKERGWSEQQATGISANICAESNFCTTAVGDNGRSHGLSQWNGQRLKDYEALYGHSINDPRISEAQRKYEQLNFIDHELKHNESKAGALLAQAKTSSEAAAIFSASFERPADSVGEAQKRAAIAREIESARNNANAHDAPALKPAIDDNAAQQAAAVGQSMKNGDVKVVSNTGNPAAPAQQYQLPASNDPQATVQRTG